MVLIAGLGTLGCGAAEPESTHRFEVETVDGAEIATNRGGPLFTEPLFTLEQELTLVQDPSNEESLLYQPRSFARGGDGNYYVADSGNSRIAVFDSTGQYSHSLGREGQGPGEFSDSFDLVAPFDAEIQAYDRTAQRTLRFAFDGSFIDSVALLTEGRAESLAREPDGTLVFTRSDSEFDDDLYLEAVTIGVIPPDAEDPIAEASTGSMVTYVTSTLVTDEFTATVLMQIPFGGTPLAFRRADGLVLVNGETGRVEWRAEDGTLHRRALIERAPLQVTDAMRQAYDEKYRAAREDDVELGSEFPERPDPWYPEVSGWWDRGTLDDEGYLWLRDSAQASAKADEEDTRFELLSPQGEFLGHVWLPFSQFRVQEATMLARDEDPATDEARLRVFRLRASAPGFTYPER